MTISVAYTAADASVLSQMTSSSPMRMSDALKISHKFLFRGPDVSIGVCRVWSLEPDETFLVFVLDSEGSADVWDSSESGACFASVTFSEGLWFSGISLLDPTLLVFRSRIMFLVVLAGAMAEDTKDPTVSRESCQQ